MEETKTTNNSEQKESTGEQKYRFLQDVIAAQAKGKNESKTIESETAMGDDIERNRSQEEKQKNKRERKVSKRVVEPLVDYKEPKKISNEEFVHPELFLLPDNKTYDWNNMDKTFITISEDNYTFFNNLNNEKGKFLRNKVNHALDMVRIFLKDKL